MASFGGMCIWIVARENHSAGWVAFIPTFIMPLVPVGFAFVKKWKQVGPQLVERS